MRNKPLAIGITVGAFLAVCSYGATPTYVNGQKANDVTGSNIASLATPAFSVTAGNTLTVAWFCFSTGTVARTATVTDTAGNTFVQQVSNGYDVHHVAAAFVAHNVTGNASDVITVTPASSCAYFQIIAHQINGAATSGAVDVAAYTAQLGSGTTGTTGAFSTVMANEIIQVFGADDGGLGITYTAGTGYTIRQNTSTAGSETKGVSATQSGVTASMSASVGGNWDILVISLADTTVGSTIYPDDANILYTGRWDISGTGASARAKTITAGSTIDLALSVASNIQIDFSNTGITTNCYPDVLYQVDGGNPTRTTLSSSTLAITVSFPVSSQTVHRLRIIAEGITEGSSPACNQWTSQEGALIFKDLFISGNTTALTLPIGADPNTMEVLGDSIVATVRYLSDCGGGSTSNATCMAAHNSWSQQTCYLLGLRCIMSGYGGAGLTVTGSGSVPILNTAFASNFSGSAYSPTAKPIVVVIEPGANDGAASSATYKAALVTYLTTIRAAYAKALIFCMGLPSNPHASDMSTVVSTFGDSKVFYLDYTGLSIGTTDGVHPSYSGGATIAAKLSKDVQAQLTTSGIYLTNIGSGVSAGPFFYHGRLIYCIGHVCF